MPHPEHAVDPLTGSTDGLRLFESAVAGAGAGLSHRGRRGGAPGYLPRPMRVGICAFWFNRGQGVVARQLRSALDELGHETFVLGRPTKETFPMPQEAREDDVWAQEGVTAGLQLLHPRRRAPRLGAANAIEACFFDQNYEFDAIARAARVPGVRTIGRFVWERFSDEHVEPARRRLRPRLLDDPGRAGALRGDGDRGALRAVGRPPRVLDEIVARHRAATIARSTFHYHAGLLGKRKPFKEVINAFSATPEPELRLIVKAQIERRMKFLEKAVKRDPRIELVLEDLPTDEHLQMFADADVCMAPARWEGLGLHLYEAIAFGQPIVCNDDPPMNELVIDGVNGLLVPSHHDGLANSGIPARTVDVDGADRRDLAPRRPRPARRALRRRPAGPRGALVGSHRRGLRLPAHLDGGPSRRRLRFDRWRSSAGRPGTRRARRSRSSSASAAPARRCCG